MDHQSWRIRMRLRTYRNDDDLSFWTDSCLCQTEMSKGNVRILVFSSFKKLSCTDLCQVLFTWLLNGCLGNCSQSSTFFSVKQIYEEFWHLSKVMSYRRFHVSCPLSQFRRCLESCNDLICEKTWKTVVRRVCRSIVVPFSWSWFFFFSPCQRYRQWWFIIESIFKFREWLTDEMICPWCYEIRGDSRFRNKFIWSPSYHYQIFTN